MGPLEIILTVVAAIFIIAVIAKNVRVVSQATQYVIERLGKYRTTWNAGLHLKFPFIESVRSVVNLKEQVLDTPPQPVITSDNVTMQIDAVVYFRVFDAMAYTYGVTNPIE
ncbi:MAG: peptidase, partial [Clostridia bacterium]|nr:peptidase [Clostridia bacterium]